jgi:hypothetical protein
MPYFSKAVAASKSVELALPPIVTSGLLTWLAPESIGPSTWTDLSGNGVDGTFVNGAGASTDPNGVDAVYFDGINDRCSVRNDSVFTWPGIYAAGTGFTIEMWVRSSSGWLSDGNLWSAYGNGGIRCRIEGSSTWTYPSIRGGTSHSVVNLSPNQWWLLTTVYDPVAGTIDSYTRGNLRKSQSSGWNPDTWFGGLTMLGAYQSSSEFQRMFVSTFRIYNRPLSAAEVQTNWNAEKAYHGF